MGYSKKDGPWISQFVSQPDRIELVIEGLPEHQGRVRLTTFMSQLQSLSAALRKIDRDLGEGPGGCSFQIVALSYNSPYRVALQAIPSTSALFTGPMVLEALKQVTEALTTGAPLDGYDADLLEEIQSIAKPVGRDVKNTALVFDETSMDLTQQVYNRVDVALGVTDECEGTIEGTLEQINLHRGANKFCIYPLVGPRKVTCHFPSILIDDAVSAVGRKVEVSGLMQYRTGAAFAHQIAVSHIEILPPENDMPDWDDVRGRARDATGVLSSEAFIRELRDAWS